MGPKKSSYMNKNVKFNLMRSEKKKKNILDEYPIWEIDTY